MRINTVYLEGAGGGFGGFGGRRGGPGGGRGAASGADLMRRIAAQNCGKFVKP